MAQGRSAWGLEAFPRGLPTGRRIAFTGFLFGALTNGMHLMRPDGSERTRLTEIGSLGPVAWSPDGSRILFSSVQIGVGAFDIYVMEPDGSELIRLTCHPASDDVPCWIPIP